MLHSVTFYEHGPRDLESNRGNLPKAMASSVAADLATDEPLPYSGRCLCFGCRKRPAYYAYVQEPRCGFCAPRTLRTSLPKDKDGDVQRKRARLDNYETIIDQVFSRLYDEGRGEQGRVVFTKINGGGRGRCYREELRHDSLRVFPTTCEKMAQGFTHLIYLQKPWDQWQMALIGRQIWRMPIKAQRYSPGRMKKR